MWNRDCGEGIRGGGTVMERDVEQGMSCSSVVAVSGEPDNRDMDSEDNADCLMVSIRGTWKDQDCNRTRKSVCKRQAGMNSSDPTSRSV